jgi:hypothetical protein
LKLSVLSLFHKSNKQPQTNFTIHLQM